MAIMTRDEAAKELKLLLNEDKFGHDVSEFRSFISDIDEDENKQEAAQRFMQAAERYKGGDVLNHLSIYDFYTFYEEVQDEKA